MVFANAMWRLESWIALGFCGVLDVGWLIAGGLAVRMAGTIITGLAKTLAYSRALSCLQQWIAQPAWGVFLGGLLAVRGLSGLLAGADSRVCQGTWLARSA